MIVHHESIEALELLREVGVYFCDVDNTICHSAQSISKEMAEVISRTDKTFVFISGTDKDELLKMLSLVKSNFYILGNSGSQCFHKDGISVRELYNETMKEDDQLYIVQALECAIKEFNLPAEAPDQILKRGSQVTLSCIGRSANPALKEAWDPDLTKRRKIVEFLRENIQPRFSINIGGTTSIDILKGNFNKADGIKRFKGTDTYPSVMVGDKFNRNGNDFPVLEQKLMPCIRVDCPEDFLKLLKEL
jgi:HAD superfamily hydrolase (TIGR01484 family)